MDLLSIVLVVLVLWLGVLAAVWVMYFLTRRKAREVSPEVQAKLQSIPRYRKNAHKVTAVMSDGEEIRRVGIAWGKYVPYPLGRQPRVDPKAIIDVRPWTGPPG